MSIARSTVSGTPTAVGYKHWHDTPHKQQYPVFSHKQEHLHAQQPVLDSTNSSAPLGASRSVGCVSTDLFTKGASSSTSHAAQPTVTADKCGADAKVSTAWDKARAQQDQKRGCGTAATLQHAQHRSCMGSSHSSAASRQQYALSCQQPK